MKPRRNKKGQVNWDIMAPIIVEFLVDEMKRNGWTPIGNNEVRLNQNFDKFLAECGK